jgi:predicted RND superfamily exporter protein
MKSNVGRTDKVIRVIIGAVIIVLGITFKSWWGLIGVLPILTAVFGFCVLYTVFGINTAKPKTPPQQTPGA